MLIYQWPEWAKARRADLLTEVEKERIRVNAHIPLAQLARLMGRDERTLRRFARANGIPTVPPGRPRVQRKPKAKAQPKLVVVRKPVYRAQEVPAAVARMVSLAQTADLGARWEVGA